MNTPEAEYQLREAIERLEALTAKTVKTEGYKAEAQKLRLLIELIKEQVRNENTLPAARAVR